MDGFDFIKLITIIGLVTLGVTLTYNTFFKENQTLETINITEECEDYQVIQENNEHITIRCPSKQGLVFRYQKPISR